MSKTPGITHPSLGPKTMASVPSEFVQFGNDIWLVKADKEQNGVDYSQPTYVLAKRPHELQADRPLG